MIDPESGIKEYRLTIFATSQGSTSKFYPKDPLIDITIQPQSIGESGVLTCWSDDTLQLSSGTLYTVRITPVNRADLSTSYSSTGIIPDNTAPIIDFVRIDTYGDESEERTEDGSVEIGNSDGIPVQWVATDIDSGIAGFEAAVGTSSEGTDILDYQLYSADINVIIPVELQLFEDTGKYYYVTVRAKNGAGLLSDRRVSTKIKVLRANVAGVVTVGHSGVGISGNYQPERDTITLRFEGFSSELCSIQYYEWSIGTTFAEDQIQETSTAGVVTEEDGAGVAQALIPLVLGESIYTEVKAVTACSTDNRQSTINSFGHVIIVDWTAPLISLRGLGLRTNGTVFENPEPDARIYQFNPSTLVAQWNGTDPQSGIQHFQYKVGSYPYSDDIRTPRTTSRMSLGTNAVDPIQTGKPNILQITTFNKAGVSTFLIAPGITIDTRIPNIQLLEFACTSYALNSTGSLTCNWHGAFDRYSEIVNYQLDLGNSELDKTYYSELLESSTLRVAITNFSTPLIQGVLTYTLRIINSVGLTNYAFATLIVDNTPPIPGSVSVLIDQTISSFLPTGQLNTTFSYMNDSAVTQCKTIITNIRVKWEEFIDGETPMEYYEIGLGENRGQINIMNYLNVGLVDEYYIEGLDLTRYTSIYVIVRGFNRLGLLQVANSQEIYISLHNPITAIVYDGSNSEDLEAQSGTSYIEASWDFNDYCPGVNYSWAIFYFNQTFIQNYTTVITRDSSNDNLALGHESRVYVIVNFASPLGYIRSARSNGITVQVEPLIPGIVYDGPYPGVDFNHQASLTTIIANWNSFGGTNPTRLSEKVIQYELGIGNETTGDGRFNVVALHSVYLNTSITMDGLTLELDVIYYVTVRATSGTFSIATVTSNGIEPIEFENIIQAGSVSIPLFQSVTTYLGINWMDFSSLLPIVSYEYAISTNDSLANFSCESLENAANPLGEVFTVRQYTRTGSTSSVVVSGLELQGDTKYYAYIRVIDDSFRCMAAVSNPVVIDITPPVLGWFNIGYNVTSLRPDSTQPQISYITTNNTVYVTWVGFYDPESAISNYQIQLVEQDGCNLDNCDELTGLTTITNVTNHTFYVLDVLPDKFYFVALRAINRAGLTSCAVSQPIKLDMSIPNEAVVKHASDWTSSPPYQGSTVSMQGILALVTDLHDAVCMDRMYNVSSPSEDWDTITQDVTPTIPVGPNNPTGITLAYTDKQAMFNSNEAFLEISMTRDIQQDRMLSAAVYTEVQIVNFNEMSVRIKAAGGYRAVTSVLVWDGPDMMIQDYEILIPSDNNTQINSTISEAIEPTTTCQYLPPPNPNPPPYKAFGLQIHPAFNSTSAMALIWYRGDTIEETAHIWIELDFDPSTDYHVYHITLEKVDSVTPTTVKEATWSVKLNVDNDFLGSLVDLPQFGSSLKYVLHVRNYNGRVEPFTSPFFPPTTTAYFSEIILPVDSNRVCKYGSPFYSERAPFIKFEVGVGSGYGLTDVSLAAGQEYQPIQLPCIPCNQECSQDPASCNSSCNSTVYYISFEATGLELLSGCTHPLNQTNVTCIPYNYTESGIPEDELYLHNLTFVPYVYYMTVRGYTAAGHVAYGYSRGIHLDPTPPNCTLIQHIERDIRSDFVSNTTLQYSITSLAVQYECRDTGSDIYGYQIAYTDNLDDIDSLDYNSVGTDALVNITGLSLNPQLKYYVVVIATNGAGLTTILESGGVSIQNNEPDVSRSVIQSMNSIEIDTQMPNTSISASLTSLGLSWTGFYGAEYQEDPVIRNQTLFWEIGSKFGTDDILPIFEINYLNSFSIRIEDITVIGNTSFYVSNITDLAQLANRTEYTYTQGDLIMRVEPGRVLYQTLVLCALQPECVTAGTTSVTFYREGYDEYSVYNGDSEFSLSLAPGSIYLSGSTNRFIPPQLYPTGVDIYFSDDITDKAGFVYGNLTYSDMMENYDIISTLLDSPYVPYIANPSTLGQVDRFLHSRVKDFLGPAFFLSPIGGADLPSSLRIVVDRSFFSLAEGQRPELIAWNPDNQIWIDTRSSCNFTEEDIITDDTLTTYFCPCTDNQQRCNKPWQFILILADSEFVDTSPVPDTVPCISISGDSGTIEHVLSYTDAQNDPVAYDLTSVVFTQANSQNLVDVPSTLDVAIVNGVLSVTPCTGCFGNATIQYDITETGTPALLGSPLSASNEITVEILAVNNPPIILLNNTFEDIITLYREENDSIASIDITVDSYDIDEDDLVRFSYLNCTYCELIVSEINPSDNPNIPSEYVPSSSTVSLYYTAYSDYYGPDRMGVVAEDISGAYSLAHIFSLYIRYKPCLNNATCIGPAVDPECNTLLTPDDFTEAYSCNCTPAWMSRRCNTANPCYAQPCPFNTTCNVTDDGRFQCICQPEWPCFRYNSISGGAIAAIVISILIVILIIAAVALVVGIYLKKKQMKVHLIVNPKACAKQGEEFEIEEHVDATDVTSNVNVCYKEEFNETVF
ncbi:hypothetical protein LOD99_10426 [Oopsacas minuta]|uniref:Fibronectin type-III domain-containing protein n=1 Tax=Oopsacas minuta TaxID=111878 RepID=A0AAV7KGQ2_9METZ|nr:hypothetical protein LOD99_10426 [Oopsacas minuta]